MNRLYRYFREKNYQTIIMTVFLIGICVHGSRIFTAYYAHDDASMVGVGTTYTSGRWVLQMLYKLQMWIMGSSVNAKGFMGMTVLILFATICCMIAHALNMKTQRSLILLSGTIITFPYMPSILSYTYTAPHYCIAIILSLSAAILSQSGISSAQKLFRTALAIALLGASMAIYQTSLCIYIAFLAVLAIKNSLGMKSESWHSYILRCLRYLGGCIGGSVFYYLSNSLVLHIKGFSMSGYQGLNHMEEITLTQFFERAAFAYREFFTPAPDKNYSFYRQPPIRFCYSLLIVALFICVAVFLIREAEQKNFRKMAQLSILFCILPLAVHSVFLTADTAETNIYSLMMFSDVMLYVSLIDATERLCGTGKTNPRLRRLGKIGYSATVVLLIYEMVYFSYIANVCYTKAAIQQEQTIGYFNRLIVRIQMTEGYSEGTNIAYVNEWNKNIENQPMWFIDQDGYSIAAYNYSSLINMYNWRDYMQMWCGFRAPEVSPEKLAEYAAMPEVQEMPTYPYDGSIKLIDGTIVVKFDPY